MATNPDNEPTTWRNKASKRLADLEKRYTKELADLKEEMRRNLAEEPHLYPHPGWYTGSIIVYALLHIAVGIVATSMLDVVTPDIPVNVGLLILILQVVHIFMSLRSVTVDNLAGIDFFGFPISTPKSGLYVVPFGLMRLNVASRNYKDPRFPGPPDKIYRVPLKKQEEREGGDMPPEGKFRPIYVTTGEPDLSQTERDERKRDGANPLDEQLNIEVSYFVRYRPHQEYGSIFRLVRQISAQGKDIDKAVEDLLREQTERDIKELIAGQTTATIIENQDIFNDVFTLKTQVAVLRLGIDVDRAGLAEINPSHDLNTAQRNARKAAFTRIETITNADAEREQIIRRGQGAAEAERLRLVAIAEGYKKIKDDTGASGEAIIASETAKEVIGERADTVLLGAGAGLSDLLGIVKAGQQVLKKPEQGKE